MGRPTQQSVLKLLKGLNPLTFQERTMTVWRGKKPPEAFDGYDIRWQDDLVKFLLYSPGYTVYGMTTDGVPLTLGQRGELSPLTIPEFSTGAPAASIATVPAGEIWELIELGFLTLTAGGGPARRVILTVTFPTFSTFSQHYRSEATQLGGNLLPYALARGSDISDSAAFVPPVNQIRTGNGLIAVAGQSINLLITTASGLDSFFDVHAAFRRWSVPI